MAYQQLATMLVLDATTVVIEFSPAVSMAGHDAAQFNVTLFRLTATNVKVTIQESNDLENWRDISGSTNTITGEGYVLGDAVTGIASSYVRLEYEITGSGSELATLAAGIHLSQQS